MAPIFSRVNALAPRQIRQAHPEVRRFIKFMIVGGVGALIDYTVLFVLHFAFGMPEEYANLISVTCAIISNFTWNRLWTFPESQQHAVHTQFGQFAVVNLIGLAINEAVLLGTNHYLFERLIPGNEKVSLSLAKAAAIGVVLFWNFGANRIWTYRHIPIGHDGTAARVDEGR